MTDHTTSQAQLDRLVTAMTDQLQTLTRSLGTWMTSEARTLGELEQQVMRTLKDLGASLLSGVAQLAVPTYPSATSSCACGQTASYVRMRSATVTTVLGPISLSRPYYHCAACHHGHAPLDQQLGLCAGSISDGLDELLALLGATQDSFPAAVAVLEKLSLVSVCPNTLRASTEQLGQVLQAHEQQIVASAYATSTPPPVRVPPAPCMYVSMDGVLVHIRCEGWKEVKLGAVYTTRTCRSRRKPDHLEVRTVACSFVADLAEAAAFGPQLWAEAAQRGVPSAAEVVVLGDGSHWIWNLAATYFPQAVQILDWYHVTTYVWAAAYAIYGEGSSLAKEWAKQQLDRLWDGKVAKVLNALQDHSGAADAVAQTVTYFTEHQGRMHYAEYRARGLQIGSGTIESGCKQVIGARLKQAGMIWQAAGAVAVGKVRTWLKSGRWEEAMRLRPRRQRTYQRRKESGTSAARTSLEEADGPVASAVEEKQEARPRRKRRPVPTEVPAPNAGTSNESPVRPAADHPWRKPWSRRQQRRLAEAEGAASEPALAA